MAPDGGFPAGVARWDLSRVGMQARSEEPVSVGLAVSSVGRIRGSLANESLFPYVVAFYGNARCPPGPCLSHGR